MRSSTPPRKRVIDDVSSAAGPQVIFSPGKRLSPDGTAHDAVVEVKAFLRRKGVADADIPCMMSQRANATPSAPSSGPSVKASSPLFRPATAPKPLKLADHAKTLTEHPSSPRSGNQSEALPDTFSADLFDVLDGAPEMPSIPSSSSSFLGVSPPLHRPVGCGTAEDIRLRNFAVPGSGTLGAHAPAGDRGRLCPLLSQELQAGLCEAADAVDRRASEASVANAASQSSQEESVFDGVDDDELLAAVREVEQRLLRKLPRSTNSESLLLSG